MTLPPVFPSTGPDDGPRCPEAVRVDGIDLPLHCQRTGPHKEHATSWRNEDGTYEAYTWRTYDWEPPRG